MEKFPDKNLPEYDPYTGDRNPYLIDTTVPNVSRLSALYYIFLFGSVLSCANLVLSFLIGDGVLQIIAWSCAVVYSVGCSIYERLRCRRRL
jgi:hypothetical protein